MRKLHLGLLVAAAWPLAPQGALAQDKELFDRLDANKDGFVTPDEAGGEDRKRLFERLLRTADKNKDGKLSREEFAEGTKARAEEPRDERPAGGPNLGQILERLDRNGDGKISKDEAAGPLSENFERVDANKDGFLDKEELGKALAQFGGRPDGQLVGPQFFEEQFKRNDANKDGKLTVDEIPEGLREQFNDMLKRLGKEKEGVTMEEYVRFVTQRGGPPGRPGQPGPGAPGFPGVGPLLKALDTNSDGEISAEEIAAAPKTLLALDKNGDGKLTRDELIPAPPSGPALNPQAFLERLREADTNGDGKLSKEEAPPYLRERFEQLDANKDGFVDKEELQKAFSQRPDRRPDGDRRPDAEKPDAK